MMKAPGMGGTSCQLPPTCTCGGVAVSSRSQTTLTPKHSQAPDTHLQPRHVVCCQDGEHAIVTVCATAKHASRWLRDLRGAVARRAQWSWSGCCSSGRRPDAHLGPHLCAVVQWPQSHHGLHKVRVEEIACAAAAAAARK
jgi:hypothetical protein